MWDLVLFVTNPRQRGGTITFSHHLARCLGSRVYRLMNRPQRPRCTLGGVLEAECVSWRDFRPERPFLVTAIDDDLAVEWFNFVVGRYRRLAYYTFHDPTRWTQRPGMILPPREHLVVIREGNRRYGDIYIPHPYFRERPVHLGTHRAVCHARIAPEKRTMDVVAAALGYGADIHIAGSGTRRYQHHIGLLWPGWQGAAPYECSGAEMAARGVWNVDMTLFRGDGGGTQYTSLEAMDAGAVPLIRHDWGDVPFKAGRASTPLQIARAVADDPPEHWSWENEEYLERHHSPDVVREAVCEAIAQTQ